MPGKSFHHWSKSLGRWWDRRRRRFGLGNHLPVSLAAYRGYARKDHISLSGRVLRDKAIIRRDSDTFWRNLINNVKRFNSREINGAHVKVRFHQHEFELITDAEGYFVLDEELNPALELPENAPLWQKAQLSILSVPGQKITPVAAEAIVLMPGHADFGIISDIDDTIIKSDVTGLLKLRTLYLTLLKNAGTRIAFRMVSAFFRALKAGPQGESQNPFFYVSNSPLEPLRPARRLP